MRSNLWALTLASALFLPLTISIGVGATEVAPKSAAPAVPEALAVAATSAAPAPASAVPPTAAQVPTAAGEPGGVLSSEPEFGAGSEEDCAPDLAVRAADQTGLFAEAMPPQEAAASNVAAPEAAAHDVTAHQGGGAEGTAAPEPLPEPLVFLLAEAQRGSVDAQVLLARAFEVGPHKDRAVALHWWEQAALAHDPRAELALARILAQGRGVEQDLKQALYWLERAAQGGNSSAQLLLALHYKSGQHNPLNEKIAAYWFEQAALSGNGVAQAQIAQCYEHGIGVPLDRQKAFYWHQFAAIHDANIASKLYVGQALKEASGVSRDFYYAYGWLSEAVEEGEPLAQVLLGNMYAQGQGVAEDDAIAVSLYQQAAAKNNAIAQFQLGLAFYSGRGIEPDRYQAKVYVGRACDQGLSDACRFAQEQLADEPRLFE